MVKQRFVTQLGANSHPVGAENVDRSIFRGAILTRRSKHLHRTCQCGTLLSASFPHTGPK
jgi:hypothetical protein